MFGIFEMDGRGVKFRVFKDQAFVAPQAAVDWLAANVGVIVDAEVTDEAADVCVGRALQVFAVEPI